MTRISSDGRSAAPAFLALAAIGFVASAPAYATDAAADPVDEQDQRADVVVTGKEVKSEQESPKATRPVRDTPQTVTILTAKTIEEQNLLTLRDVLTTVPGITFGAGEGGGGYGDSITLRGYSANTDITVDGVRDSAQYTRTDSFNLEQIEVVNGANSVYSGAGSVGGSINIVTKRPLERTQIVANAGIGTDDYYRGTVDANIRASEFIAFRLNAMVHKNDIPGRDVENYERWGVAPSVTLGIGGPTSLTLQYLHQEDTNIPQYGVPYYVGSGGLIHEVDKSDYFGYRNVDTQRINVDQATAIFDHEFSDSISIRNLTRWQDVRQFARVNPPQGSFCLSTGLLATGAPCPATVPAGYYLPSGPRGTTRSSRNQLGYTQTDLKAEFGTGGVAHTLVLGFSAAWEKYFLESGNSQRNADGSNPNSSYPLINIANPNEVVVGPAGFTYGSNVYTGPINFIPTARQNGELENFAVYLFDTIAFSDQLELNGGVRYEHNSGWYRADTVASSGANLGQVTPGERFENSDDLFSYRVGLVFKPVPEVSLYAAYGNSKTPSKTSVNGSCTAATCNVKPESALNYEIGAKAELMGGDLLLTFAAFRNERDQYKVASADPLIPEQQLDGRSRVNGIALGAVGQISDAWSITANYTYLDSEILQSVADGVADPAVGADLQNTPTHSGSLFTTYTLPFGLRVGYGVTFQGDFALNLPTATNNEIYRVQDYWVHNAFLAYDFTENFSAQLNIKNATDADYFTRIRNNAGSSVGWATAGESRSAVLTLGYRF
ncbi:TonB-dependent siderophore receptor [Sphingomonas suaedae]|uniref:TonB-dependent siderophore receptor n=1 Tax=Sphingomonas suaedae TaxID=2599297 RepID=A0A518RJA2_9SPHN|nr:TonB-dependent siderophore receptor [Sphingomonas suaedae]QDX27499.1 TonB-dependent siderophore receptor [Sphingomonas suaedae]